MQWIKASELMPDEPWKKHWRDVDTKQPVSQSAVQSAVRTHQKEFVEWLDESLPGSADAVAFYDWLVVVKRQCLEASKTKDEYIEINNRSTEDWYKMFPSQALSSTGGEKWWLVEDGIAHEGFVWGLHKDNSIGLYKIFEGAFYDPYVCIETAKPVPITPVSYQPIIPPSKPQQK